MVCYSADEDDPSALKYAFTRLVPRLQIYRAQCSMYTESDAVRWRPLGDFQVWVWVWVWDLNYNIQ
jgi:hypothetical protein